MKLRKGDHVRVIAARTSARRRHHPRLPEFDKVIVDGVNVAKRHTRATGQTMQGGIIDKDMPLHVSNVAIVCTGCDQPTRVGYRFEDDGTKVRVCCKCGKDL